MVVGSCCWCFDLFGLMTWTAIVLVFFVPEDCRVVSIDTLKIVVEWCLELLF